MRPSLCVYNTSVCSLSINLLVGEQFHPENLPRRKVPVIRGVAVWSAGPEFLN